MPKTVAILHFQPPELYPPLQNLLQYLATHYAGTRVLVFTTHCTNSGLPRFKRPGNNITLYRLGKAGNGLPAATRYFTYLLFNAAALLALLFKKIPAVLYFETLSAFPAAWFKKLHPAKRLLIHYHEYVSPAEFVHGMKLVQYFHRLEKKVYPNAGWISQTNKDRLEMFLQDEQLFPSPRFHVLPNYPPASWQRVPQTPDKPFRVVYIGSLSLDTMYTREFAEWVIQQQGVFTWDIYSQNITAAAAAWINSMGSEYIRLHPGIAYEQLPELLPQFHAGVILYKGHIPNFVYNIPNKLYEYSICGLDVWFPLVMKGCLPCITQGSYPRIIGLDFEHLSENKPEAMTDRKGLTYMPSPCFFENALPALAETLMA